MPDLPDVPDTVTEAVVLLQSQGYTDDLRLDPEGVRCDTRAGCHPVDAAVVDQVFRFEGPSDPADEAIVLGISLPDWSLKGVLVAAYGADMPPAEAAVLQALTATARP